VTRRPGFEMRLLGILVCLCGCSTMERWLFLFSVLCIPFAFLRIWSLQGSKIPSGVEVTRFLTGWSLTLAVVDGLIVSGVTLFRNCFWWFVFVRPPKDYSRVEETFALPWSLYGVLARSWGGSDIMAASYALRSKQRRQGPAPVSRSLVFCTT